MHMKLEFFGYRPKKWEFKPKTFHISQKTRERVLGRDATGIFQIWIFGTQYMLKWRF